MKQQGGPLQAQAVSAPEAAPQSAYEEPAEPAPQAPMSEDPAQETQAERPPASPEEPGVAEDLVPAEPEESEPGIPPHRAPSWKEAAAARALTQSLEAELGADAPGARDNAGEASSGGGLEQRLAGAWLIWLGGAALALGGAFLVKSAIDAGFFGPGMRIFSALCAGAAMIAASEWLRRTEPVIADEDGDEDDHEDGEDAAGVRTVARLRGGGLAPPVLAAAGGATLYGTIFAAYGLYGMLSGLAALALLTAACGGMVALAALHRAPLVALLGLIGAYISPLLTASGTPNPDALMLYVYGVSAAGLVVARVMSWRGVSYAALAGGIIWPLLWVMAADGHVPVSLYVYPPVYLLLAAFIAWEDAEAPFDVNALFDKGVKGFSVSLAAFYLASLAVAALALLITLEYEAAPQAVSMWGAISMLTLFCAWRREAFSLAPVLMFLAVLLLTAFTDFGESMVQLTAGVAFAALFGVGGYAVMSARAEKGPAAALAAFAPIAFLAALFYQAGQPSGAILWSLAALILVAVNVAVLAGLMRRFHLTEAHPGAVSALVLGATLASTLSVAMYADGFMMSAGIALQAPLLVLLWRRFRLPALKYGAGALAAIATARLFWLPEVLADDFGALPVLNWLIVAYLLPAAGFWMSAVWLREGGLERRSRILQGLEGGAIALFAAFATLQIRHFMNDGALDEWSYSLTEVSLQTINWISIAAFLRWRYGADLTAIRRLAEVALIAVAGAHMVLFNLLTLNPWWGDGPYVQGPPVFNLLSLAYLAPAAAFGAFAYAAQRSGALFQSRAAGLFAVLLSYCWLILSIRQAFHGADLAAGAAGDGEAWAYSVATVLYGTLLLVAGAFRRSAMLCVTGLGAQFLAALMLISFDAAGLKEVSLQIIIWTLTAAFLRRPFSGEPAPVFILSQRMLAGLAAAHMALFNLLALNPWWGGGPDIAGPVVFNFLAFAYLAPAAAGAVLAFAAWRAGVANEARAAGLASALVAYVWLILSVRHGFHAPDLSSGRIGDAESWVYSIATILYGTLLLVAGAFRRSAVLRFAGLGALMLAACKVFLFDMAGLDGVWRASSFLGLGAALVGIAVLYQRLLAPMLAGDGGKETAPR